MDSGGILSLSSVTVKDSESTSNTSGGGGIRSDGGSVTITNSAIYGNTAGAMGGGLNLAGVATITSTTIYNNIAGSGFKGGGIHILDPASETRVTINRSSIYSNTIASGNGGGISVIGAQEFSLKNSTVYGNSAANGGGLYVRGGTVNVTHVTFVDNRATNANGAGVRRQGGTLRLRNTIIANTTAADGTIRRDDCDGTLDQNRDNLIEDGSCSADHSGDPKLASLTTGPPPYYALEDDSPAIGEGHDTHCGEESTDQAGNTRPATSCDIGAVENSRSAPVPTDTPTPTATATLVPGDLTVNASCSLPDAITAANTDTATGGCPAGLAGADTITITQAGTSGGAITLSSQLAVNGTSSQDSIITINGGNFTVSGDDSVRVFLVQQYGDLTINNLTITDGRARQRRRNQGG